MCLRVLLTTLIIVSLKVAKAELPCGDEKYNHNSRCCKKCQAGFYVETHCRTNVSETKCHQCPNGTFASGMNHKTYCQRCRQCNPGMVLVKSCSPTTDNKCACLSTQYHHTSLDMCMACTPCGIGKYPIKACSKNQDTQCKKCAKGYYSDSPNNFNSTCKKCTTCTKYKISCSETHNALCDDAPEMTLPTSKTPTSVLFSDPPTTETDDGDNSQENRLDTMHIVLIMAMISLCIIFGIFIYVCKKKRSIFRRRRARFTIFHESRYEPLTTGLLLRDQPSTLFFGLCERLNPPGPRNWKKLAMELGLTPLEIGNCECDPKNPAETMLSMWQTKDSATVDTLYECLRKIGREDIARYVADNISTNNRESIV